MTMTEVAHLDLWSSYLRAPHHWYEFPPTAVNKHINITFTCQFVCSDDRCEWNESVHAYGWHVVMHTEQRHCSDNSLFTGNTLGCKAWALWRLLDQALTLLRLPKCATDAAGIRKFTPSTINTFKLLHVATADHMPWSLFSRSLQLYSLNSCRLSLSIPSI